MGGGWYCIFWGFLRSKVKVTLFKAWLFFPQKSEEDQRGWREALDAKWPQVMSQKPQQWYQGSIQENEAFGLTIYCNIYTKTFQQVLSGGF